MTNSVLNPDHMVKFCIREKCISKWWKSNCNALEIGMEGTLSLYYKMYDQQANDRFKDLLNSKMPCQTFFLPTGKYVL